MDEHVDIQFLIFFIFSLEIPGCLETKRYLALPVKLIEDNGFMHGHVFLTASAKSEYDMYLNIFEKFL